MSRAFVKDNDDRPEQPAPIAISDAPNYVTPRGLQQLHERLDAAIDGNQSRDEAYLRERIASAILIAPKPQAVNRVEFGATVRAHDEQGAPLEFTIVGEDEADAADGKLSHQSPVARAFSGHRPSDRVVVARPAGVVRYTIDAISYDA